MATGCRRPGRYLLVQKRLHLPKLRPEELCNLALEHVALIVPLLEAFVGKVRPLDLGHFALRHFAQLLEVVQDHPAAVCHEPRLAGLHGRRLKLVRVCCCCRCHLMPLPIPAYGPSQPLLQVAAHRSSVRGGLAVQPAAATD